jgi:hypothetical protein
MASASWALEPRCFELKIIPVEQPVPERGVDRFAEARRNSIQKEIAHAQNMLDGFDPGEGYSAETLARAVAFLKNFVQWMWKTQASQLPTPAIGPGPEGSADLYWKTRTFEMLVNIPAGDSNATFFWREGSSKTAKGNFDPRQIENSSLASSWITM